MKAKNPYSRKIPISKITGIKSPKIPQSPELANIPGILQKSPDFEKSLILEIKISRYQKIFKSPVIKITRFLKIQNLKKTNPQIFKNLNPWNENLKILRSPRSPGWKPTEFRKSLIAGIKFPDHKKFPDTEKSMKSFNEKIWGWKIFEFFLMKSSWRPSWGWKFCGIFYF